MSKDVRTRVLDVLNGQRDKALFLTELAARLTGETYVDVANAAAEMDGEQLLVMDQPSPDPHFTGDMRIVALADPADADGARRSAELVWSRWLRDVLSRHRCG